MEKTRGSKKKKNVDGHQVVVPSEKTLSKYGLTEDEWINILRSQNFKCPICEKEPDSGYFVTDHEHVPKWKAMLPEIRKTFVRGITCWWCNKNIIGRSVTERKLCKAIDYFRRYRENKRGHEHQ